MITYNRAMLSGVALLILSAGQVDAEAYLKKILARVSEEAEVFARTAPQTLSEETLRQRAARRPSRFRPRIGKSVGAPPPPLRYQEREIVSEYGYSTLKDSPGALHEFRQVVSVDGRRVNSPEKARRTLTIGVVSQDDRVKKRMLEDFEKHGLAGAATDFGQIILLFVRRRLDDFRFSFGGSGHVGADNALVLAFRQTGGAGSLTVFRGREATRQALEGRLWVRLADYVPLRISLESNWVNGQTVLREEATVDYAMSAHGVVLPVSVVHREHAGGQLLVENTFRYAPFRKFSVDAEIKFTELPERGAPMPPRFRSR